jgi:hypothetical protein
MTHPVGEHSKRFANGAAILPCMESALAGTRTAELLEHMPMVGAIIPDHLSQVHHITLAELPNTPEGSLL